MSDVREHRARDYASAIDSCRTSKDAADLYADGLMTYGPDGMNWRTVNSAVLRRWSASTLDKIKRHAWKACRELPRLSIRRAALSAIEFEVKP